MPMQARDALVGLRIDDRYDIVRPLGVGGLAKLYLATDVRLQRNVAVKVLHEGLANVQEITRCLAEEARVVAGLSHPNIISVFDQGVVDGRPYIVMEYVDGRTLRSIIGHESPLPPARALDLWIQVVRGVSAAHSAGIIHRDLKPENVLVSRSGAIKVADFGLARAITSMAGDGLVIGTVSYLAPELVTKGRADARSDVYSLGIMLFELLTGRKPHTGDTPIQVVYNHVHSDVPKPSKYIQLHSIPASTPIPPYLDSLVLAATARSRSERPASAVQLLEWALRCRAALRAGLSEDDVLVETMRSDLVDEFRLVEDLGHGNQELTPERATALVKHALAVANDNPRLLVRYAERLVRGLALSPANSLYARAMELAGDDAVVLSSYARMLALVGEHDKTRLLFEKVTRSQPELAEVYVNFASAFLDMGDFQRASAALHILERLSPNDPNVKAMFARHSLAFGDPSAARDYAVKALELDPRNVEALAIAADSLSKLGRSLEAAELYTELEALSSESGNASRKRVLQIGREPGPRPGLQTTVALITTLAASLVSAALVTATTQSLLTGILLSAGTTALVGILLFRSYRLIEALSRARSFDMSRIEVQNRLDAETRSADSLSGASAARGLDPERAWLEATAGMEKRK